MKIFTNHGLFSRLSCLLAAGCISMCFSATAQAQEVITIKQAVERMLQNNLNIKQSALSVAAAQTYVQQSKAELFPTLNGGLNNDFNFGRSLNPATNQLITRNFFSGTANLSTSVDLFNGFAKINQIKQNRITLEANYIAL
jgi:outer membrane protein